MIPPPDPDEALLQQRYERETEREGNQPVLWTLLGLVLAGLFAIALQTHWFGG